MTTLALGPQWLDPDHLISTFGLLGILIVVFAESGLLIGFFLPGDSLLFTTGLLVADQQHLRQPLWLVCLLVVIAAILGDQVGYLFGRKVGPALFRRPESKLFKQENVDKAQDFFENYGPRSIVLARFVPVVRTFTPIVAGVSRMEYRTFALFNVIGGTLWGGGVTLLGYFLGQIDFVKSHIELILVAVVLVSVVPIAIEFLRSRRKNGPRGGAGPTREAGRNHRTAADRGSAHGGPYQPGANGHDGQNGHDGHTGHGERSARNGRRAAPRNPARSRGRHRADSR